MKVSIQKTSQETAPENLDVAEIKNCGQLDDLLQSVTAHSVSQLNTDYSIHEMIADIVNADDDYSVKFQEHYRAALADVDFINLVGVTNPLDVVEKFDDMQLHLFLVKYSATVASRSAGGLQ